MSICKKPIVNIILNWKRLNVFCVRSEPRQGYLFSLLLFSIALEVLASRMRQEKKKKNKRKGMQIRREAIKLFLFEGDMIAYIENCKESTD